MGDNLKVISTRDGSSTIYNQELNETYHSMHGAITESKHVFIKEGLDHYVERNGYKGVFNVFEVGFGTGLNATLAYEWASQKETKVYYETIEAYPLSDEVVYSLNYFHDAEDSQSLLHQLHQCEWDKTVEINNLFSIQKVKHQLNLYAIPSNKFDIVFYDAFAPSKQPEMWEFELINKVIEGLKSNGVFVTYCAKGQLKRDLKAMGCEVETIPGPPGKKEMVRATKIHTP